MNMSLSLLSRALEERWELELIYRAWVERLGSLPPQKIQEKVENDSISLPLSSPRKREGRMGVKVDIPGLGQKIRELPTSKSQG